MITEVKGDLLTCGADVLCHQVNLYGEMGGGIAGGDWNRVKSIVEEVFSLSPVDCTIVHLR